MAFGSGALGTAGAANTANAASVAAALSRTPPPSTALSRFGQSPSLSSLLPQGSPAKQTGTWNQPVNPLFGRAQPGASFMNSLGNTLGAVGEQLTGTTRPEGLWQNVIWALENSNIRYQDKEGGGFSIGSGRSREENERKQMIEQLFSMLQGPQQTDSKEYVTQIGGQQGRGGLDNSPMSSLMTMSRFFQ